MSVLYAARIHENARRFVESAIEYATGEWSPELTFAAVHLAAGLELLLKARLAFEDYKLIALRSHVVTTMQFEEGDFHSVRTEDCLSKLADLNVFKLNTRQLATLRAIQHLRNRAIHYIAPSDLEINAALGAGLNLYLEIEKSEFAFWDPPQNAKGSFEFFEELRRYDGFVKARMETIKDQLAIAARPRTRYFDECSRCVQDAVCIVDDYFHCLFCGNENLIEFEVQGRSIDDHVDQCPHCGRTSFAKHEWYPDGFTKECFCCGHCEGREPKWADYVTKEELPRLHSVGRDSPRNSNSSISAESLARLYIAKAD